MPSLLRLAWPSLLWEVKGTEEKEIFLTFDDGPTPNITDKVLNILAGYNAKATFFCLGKNAEAHPEILAALTAAGHSIGNHSYSHLSGWDIDTQTYLEDIKKASGYIESKLFRPPYGKVKLNQAKALQKEYSIIMWSLLSGDFDRKLDREKSLQIMETKAKPGSIIVFHDSVKAAENMYYILPKLLESLASKGFIFAALPQNGL
ncbi:MAG: polysaccharide deacetylase family protein [Flavobacteriaceae bacterium]|nr:polysaccharide deacetylase family protein [Flavobacteriaceae bacterium]